MAIAVGEIGQVFHLPIVGSVVLALVAGFTYRLEALADPLDVIFGFLGLAAVFVKFGSADACGPVVSDQALGLAVVGVVAIWLIAIVRGVLSPGYSIEKSLGLVLLLFTLADLGFYLLAPGGVAVTDLGAPTWLLPAVVIVGVVGAVWAIVVPLQTDLLTGIVSAALGIVLGLRVIEAVGAPSWTSCQGAEVTVAVAAAAFLAGRFVHRRSTSS